MSAMTLEQKRSIAKSIHEGLYRNGTVVMYSGAFERIVEKAIVAHLTAHAHMVEKVREVIESHRCIARLAGENDLRLRDTANGWADKLAAAIGDEK